MAFLINVSHLPPIQTYANAKRIFEDSKPVKGGSQSVRRIGRKYDNTKWLRQDMVDGVEVYVAGFHQTDLVYYYPTHYEISMSGWTSNSTRAFITRITGCPLKIITLSRLHPKGLPQDFATNIVYNNLPIKADVRYKFSYDNKPLEPEKHPKIYKYTIDRKALKAVREPFKPFIKYVKAMARIDRGEVDIHSGAPYTYSSLIVAMLVEASHAKMYESLRAVNPQMVHDYATRSMRYEVSVENMLDEINSAIKREHAKDILNAVEVTKF